MLRAPLVVMLPRALEGPLRAQLLHARRLWWLDQEHDRGGVYLPHALAAKYKRAAESWAWFWIFPADGISSDPRSGGDERAVMHRHHIHEKRLQRDLKAVVDAVGIVRPATVHTLATISRVELCPAAPALSLDDRQTQRDIAAPGYRLFKNASSLSSGRYRPGVPSGGIVFASTCSFSARFASR